MQVGRTPPDSLPDGFGEIWTALREADERSPSRQELARRLGVSTHTIQRILVTGDLPDFRSRRNVRRDRAWARSIARLAHHLGGNARRWVENAGIPWDAGVRAAVEDTLGALARGRRGRRDRGEAAETADAITRITARAARGEIAPVTAGVADLVPFSLPLEEGGATFFRELTRRLVGAIDPEWQVREDTDRPHRIAAGLRARPAELDLGVGVLVSPHLHRHGIEPLPVPGLSLGLAAVELLPPDGEAPSLPWERVLAPDPGASIDLLLEEGGAAWAHARGSCGVPSERMLLRRDVRIESLARSLTQETLRRRPGRVVFVSDESTVDRVRHGLERDEDHGREFRVRTIEGPPPRFRIGLAFPPGSPRWRELVSTALEEDLFGTSLLSTARLYADVLRAGARSRARTRSGTERPPWRPDPFPQATREFQIEVGRRLLGGPERESSRSAPGLESDLIARALELLPVAWQGSVLNDLLGQEPATGAAAEFLERAPRYCESCGTSLLEFRGASDRYCRYCADDRGVLRSREEVHRILADWFRSWQPDLSEPKALKRAAHLMEAMPAWSRN
jgi:hypothetical protein